MSFEVEVELKLEVGREMYSPYKNAISRDSLQTSKRGIERLGALNVLRLLVRVHFMIRRVRACRHMGARSSGGRLWKSVKTWSCEEGSEGGGVECASASGRDVGADIVSWSIFS